MQELKIQNSEEFERYKSEWIKLRRRIINQLIDKNEATINSGIIFLAKGEELFQTDKVNVKISTITALENLFKNLSDRDNLINNLEKELSEFLKESIYGFKYEHDAMKNKLYSISTFWKRSNSMITDEFKDYLLNSHFEKVEKLPKTEIHPSTVMEKQEGIIRWYSDREQDKIDPIIDKLLNRDVFSSFKFITSIS